MLEAVQIDIVLWDDCLLGNKSGAVVLGDEFAKLRRSVFAWRFSRRFPN
jgi:hypothetical protein